MVKGSGSGSGIFPDPDPGDPKRPDPDPDPQHWYLETLIVPGILKGQVEFPKIQNIQHESERISIKIIHFLRTCLGALRPPH